MAAHSAAASGLSEYPRGREYPALIGHVASDCGMWECQAGWYWWLNGVGYSCSGYIVMREQHNKRPSVPAHHIGRNEDGRALCRREWSVRIRT